MNDSIFQPHYDTNSIISHAVGEIDRKRWLIENMLLMPKHEAWLRREVRVRRAAGTTRIEGAGMDEEAVGRLLGQAHVAKPTEDERANLNAAQAYEFIDFLSDQPDIPIDELVIRQLNRYFMSGAAQTLTPGVYRKGENKVGSFVPPNQGDVPGFMRSFALWLRDEHEIHPVIKAGIAHIHLVAVHPFWDGNGRTARGLATLILQRSPFHFRKLLSLENHLFALRERYISTVGLALGERFSSGYDTTEWLEFFAFSLDVHVQDLVATLTDWHMMMQSLHDLASSRGISTRQVDGHMLAVQAGRITRSDYVEVTGVSQATASRDLADMVRRGLLVPEGNTRSRVYYPIRPESGSGEAPAEEQLPLISQ